MKKRRFIACILALQMLLLLFAGCGSSSAGADSQSEEETNVSDNTVAGAAAAVAVNADVKFVSKDYMLTTLTTSDTNITEDETGLNFFTDNSVINISITPGIQNLTSISTYMQASIPSFFTDGQAGEVSDGYLFGYRAKLIDFTCTVDGTPCEGMMALSIINQSLYMMSLIINEKTTPEEFALMQATLSNMVILSPTSVDSTTHQATYTDPYANYTNYYSEDDYYDISAWYYLPYEYYAWYQLDYSTWTDTTLFEPDWDYYSDENTYWTWGWDSKNDWVFYDDYNEYYNEAYYEAQTDYYEDYEPDSYDVWNEEEAFSDYIYYGDQGAES